jgi:hypothetical protein
MVVACRLQSSGKPQLSRNQIGVVTGVPRIVLSSTQHAEAIAKEQDPYCACQCRVRGLLLPSTAGPTLPFKGCQVQRSTAIVKVQQHHHALAGRRSIAAAGAAAAAALAAAAAAADAAAAAGAAASPQACC